MGSALSQIPMESYRKISLNATSVIAGGTITLTNYPTYNFFEITAPSSSTFNITQIITDNRSSNPIIIQASTNVTLNIQGVASNVASVNQMVLANTSPFELDGSKGDWIKFDKRGNVFYQVDAQTYDSGNSNGIAGIGITDTTYADFIADIGSWVGGAYYRITDFASVYQYRDASDLNWLTVTGPIEPIILKTLNSSQISIEAYQEAYPNDLIFYDLNQIGFTDLNNTEKGRIIRRVDTIKNIDAPYDWRHQEHRRWETFLGSGIFTESINPGGGEASQLVFTIGGSSNGGNCSNIRIPHYSNAFISSNPLIGHTGNIVIEDNCKNINIHTESTRLHFRNTCTNIKIDAPSTRLVITDSNELIINGINSFLRINNSNNININESNNITVTGCNDSKFERCTGGTTFNTLDRCELIGYNLATNITSQSDAKFIKDVESTMTIEQNDVTLISGGILDLTGFEYAGVIRIIDTLGTPIIISEMVTSEIHPIKIEPQNGVVLDIQASPFNTITSTQIVLASPILELVGAAKDWVILGKKDSPSAWYQIDSQQYYII
jgi:hypothetical protein